MDRTEICVCICQSCVLNCVVMSAVLLLLYQSFALHTAALALLLCSASWHGANYYHDAFGNRVLKELKTKLGLEHTLTSTVSRRLTSDGLIKTD